MNIFKRKTLLKDLLVGATDIHNHVLPGIDDGAQDLEQSISLLTKYEEIGFKRVIGTPHTMSDYYPNTADTINNACDKLKEALKNSNINIELTCSSEYMIDYDFEEKTDKPSELIPLADNHILVEMSYLRSSDNFDKTIYKLQLNGYTPVLAHPERYGYYHDSYEAFPIMKSKGVKLQLNALSLSDYYGDKINKTAIRLLQDGMYDYFGTDTHKLRHLNHLEKIKIKNKHAETLKQIIDHNEHLFDAKKKYEAVV